MRPLLLASFIFSFVPAAVHAQRSAGATFGVKAGASLTSFTGSAASGANSIWGFHAGVVGNFAFNDFFAIQPEVLYSLKGAETSMGQPSARLLERIHLHYLDVPVLAHFNAGSLFFEVGPQIGFALAATTHTEATGYPTQDVATTDQVNSVDFGYVGGLGYQVVDGVSVGLRYNGGFAPVLKSDTSSNATYNSAFQLYAVYSFGKR